MEVSRINEAAQKGCISDPSRERKRNNCTLIGHFPTILEREKIFAAKEAYDYVNRCGRCYQTVVTASISNAQRIDGIAVEVQHPNYEKEELAYLEMTAKENYEEMGLQKS